MIISLLVLVISLLFTQEAHAVRATCLVSWDPVSFSTLTGYGLYLTPPGGPENTRIDIPSASTSSSCLAIGVSRPGAYSIQIDAYSVTGRSSRSSVVNFTVITSQTYRRQFNPLSPFRPIKFRDEDLVIIWR